MRVMEKTIFAGQRIKITTDGKTFFLYSRSESNWKLTEKNSPGKTMYSEALESMKEIFSADISEEEKILKILNSGFFSISNL
jgi:hypothetical protein